MYSYSKHLIVQWYVNRIEHAVVKIINAITIGYFYLSGAFHLPDMQNSRYALKSGWPADRIWFSSWPAENIIYQLAVLENYSWQNVHISGWLAADFSPAGSFEEKYAAGSFR